MKEKEYWLWLSRIPGLGYKTLFKLLKHYKTLEEIWNLEKGDIRKIKGLGEEIEAKLLHKMYKVNIEKYMEYMEKHKIKLISILDKEYPSILKEIYDPPIVLFVQGKEENLNQFLIGMVGCRNCSKYGEVVAKEIAYQLAKHNIGVVSGLAKGIDTFSHIGSLYGKGRTIAVLGNGLDTTYPKENEKIRKEILSFGGTIISEYVMGTKPERMNFPARNRIISGLSKGIVVVEARQKSGSMITVEYALEQGKEVFAVPGNIQSKTAEGTNFLIKEGAKIVRNVNDILDEYLES